MRLADKVGTQANPATQLRGRRPPQATADNGGAQALCVDDDDFTGVITSDGRRHPLT